MAELCTMVVLSTGTLDEDTHDMLEEMGEDTKDPRHFGDWRDGLTRCGHAYGHLVRVPHHEPGDDPPFDEMISHFPPCLKEGFRHARSFGAKWIHYDQDGEAHGVPTHSW